MRSRSIKQPFKFGQNKKTTPTRFPAAPAAVFSPTARAPESPPREERPHEPAELVPQK